jgi:succinate dehydrogenase hydrophobic anchor subunit
MSSSLFKKENLGELLLVILIIIYLVLGFKTPKPLAKVFSSVFGKLMLCLIVFYLFLHANPILAILALYVAFHLMSDSNLNANTRAMQKFMPSESNKMSQFTAFNQFPYTLEQEVVNKMAPIIRSGTTLVPASYQPTLDNVHDASKI